jgi:death on curing protein
VLVVRMARNHPLPDGNKRLAWQALTMFCTLNDHELHVAADDAVMTMQAIAGGELDEASMAVWLADDWATEQKTRVSAARCWLRSGARCS